MIICSKCGAENEADSVFCRKCGSQMNAGFSSGNQYSPAPKTEVPSMGSWQEDLGLDPVKFSNRRLLLILILVLVVALAVAAFFLVPKIQKSMAERKQDTYTEQQNNGETGNDGTEQNGGIVEEEKVSTYAVYASDASWLEASRNARNQGDYLVCINSREEFEEVCAMADARNLKVFWVGAKRTSSENWDDVEWADGKKITYTHWFDGEPTYYSEDGEDENYLMVFNVNGTWYYNDAINDVSKYYAGKMGYIVETKE